MSDEPHTTRVYVDMVGDLFHAGHVTLLREARRHGDHLVVGVLSDEVAASYKRRPIMTLAERGRFTSQWCHTDGSLHRTSRLGSTHARHRHL